MKCHVNVGVNDANDAKGMWICTTRLVEDTAGVSYILLVRNGSMT